MRYDLLKVCVCLIALFSVPALAQAAIPQPPPLLDRSIFDKPYMIYGSEIGAWNMDGGNAVSNPVCRQKVMEAKIRVIRWGNWAKFDDMTQGGSKPRQTLAQFSHAVDGIRSLGAYPFIKLPPVWDKQCDKALDYWNIEWLKQIIKNAGNRVQLYEFANEPNNYCHWDASAYADNWLKTVPQLKKYARSLGFEIYVGGPAWSNSYPHDIARLRTFLDAVKKDYALHHDRDAVPDFISTHTYLTEQENATIDNMHKAVDGWGSFYDALRANIDEAFSGMNDANGKPLGPQIKLADSEYDFTINDANSQQDNQDFTEAYVKTMMHMVRAHNIWLANQFTIHSHHGQAKDMLTEACAAKPLYNSYKAISAADLLNKDDPFKP
jgi:hypothetical protein